jgi:hypothetical protein
MNRAVKYVPISGIVAPADAPSVSLHVIAKNAESVLRRLLDNIGPYVREWRIILNDTTDVSKRVVSAAAVAYPNTEVFLREVTSESHPELYMNDVAETYAVGTSLEGEKFEGPFTGTPLLCDWSTLRNLGWESKCDYMLFLDADDVVVDPEHLPALVVQLAADRVSLAATKYVYGRSENGVANSVTYRERLASSGAGTLWVGKTHENLTGGLRNVLVEDSFVVTDLKDNWGRGVRVPGRCFKVLYRDARVAAWKVSSRHLAYLVQESPDMMPVEWVTDCLLPYYLSVATEPEEKAWVLSTVGEQWEVKGAYANAAEHYTAAAESYQSAKAAFRLCRVRFLQSDWRKCVEAYDLGVMYSGKFQLLDAGPVYALSSKILAAQAYCEMGNREKAKVLIDEAAASFEGTSVVKQLQEKIHAGC